MNDERMLLLCYGQIVVENECVLFNTPNSNNAYGNLKNI